jgi:CheY-like chemotaxis protein
LDDRSPVLVVDDDPDIRETLREVIEAEGFAVVCAADGQKAMEVLRQGVRPSLIVLDLMMPTMSGWEVLTALRAERAFADLPVAVISASGGRAPPPGATCSMRKPIDLDTLLDLVRNPPGRGLGGGAGGVRGAGGAPIVDRSPRRRERTSVDVRTSTGTNPAPRAPGHGGVVRPLTPAS